MQLHSRAPLIMTMSLFVLGCVAGELWHDYARGAYLYAGALLIRAIWIDGKL